MRCVSHSCINAGLVCHARECSEVDCQVSEWRPWGQCSRECGGGTQSRSRTIVVEPSSGGGQCPSLKDQKPCNTHSCSRSLPGYIQVFDSKRDYTTMLLPTSKSHPKEKVTGSTAGKMSMRECAALCDRRVGCKGFVFNAAGKCTVLDKLVVTKARRAALSFVKLPPGEGVSR